MDVRREIKEKLRENFDGKIVAKDLTKKIKEGANVPVYVLEFLLGQYCSSDDEDVIEKGVETVKRILSDNFVRPERFSSILDERKLLSLSVWENEEAINNWRNKLKHRLSQKQGRNSVFESYSITVASQIRSYTNIDRREAPIDSNKFFNI